MNSPNIDSLYDQVPLANWNGELLPLTQVKVSVLDRAFLFGDAIYEVIQLISGKPFLFADHISRLARNLEKLQLPVDAAIVEQRILQTVQQSGLKNGAIYVQITRGVAPRTHRFPNPPAAPNILIYVANHRDPYGEQRKSGASAITHPDLRWKRCDIKSVNLLANCMAAEAAYQAGSVEAILFDGDDRLIEGSKTSLFAVRNGVILTAPLGENILPGITRKLLMQLAETCGVSIQEENIYRSDLTMIDELFITGTTTGILPITKVDDTIVGDGKVGSVVTKLVAAYENLVSEF